MLKDLFTKPKRATAQELSARKDGIIASFHTMLEQLSELRHEQLASAHELNAQIVLLSAEVDSLTELAASTEKTINKISNLIE
jgi:hypothetical protein